MTSVRTMLGALGQALNSFHFGPHERKVQRYLDEATQGQSKEIYIDATRHLILPPPDSVLEDLRRALAPGMKEAQHDWITFDAYCVEDDSHQRCKWTHQKDTLKTNDIFGLERD